MAQSGYTPIQLYYSSTTTNVPLAANLASGELAINITDGKLFYKDNANAVQVIGWKVRPATAGGTGLTSFAVGDLIYADTTTTLAKLPDVATGNALISGGVNTAPSWGKIGLTTHVSGTLPTANGGTNLTSFTANGILYASSTSAITTGSALTYDGTTFIANSKALIGGTASDLSATTQAMVLGSGGFAVQYTGTTGTYLKITPGAANGTVNISADFRTGNYPNMYFQTSGATKMALFASGGVSIGNTTDPGATNLSVTGSATASKFNTVSSTTYLLTGVPATLFNANTAGMYQVWIYSTGGGAVSYSAFATVSSDGAAARIVANNTNVSLSLSGTNVQATNAVLTGNHIYAYMLIA
jgi:hypothetical protein